MSSATIRSTFYLEPALHQALRHTSAVAHRTMSDIVNEAIRVALQEDEEDFNALADRAREPTLTYEQFLDQLKANRTF
jgi:hypothetical protein